MARSDVPFCLCALTVLAAACRGDSSFTLANGTLGYCRATDDCPSAATYRGEGCSCDPMVCCLDSGIAKAKCQEYGQYVYAEDYGAALMTRRVLTNVSQCRNEVTPLIVGGVLVSVKEFPHMVSLGFGDAKAIKYMCGGTLISDQFVLTAAHCATSRDHGPALWARLGAINMTQDESDEAVQDFSIAERILHPRYKPPSRYEDIALFRLDKPAQMNGYVRPACLHNDPDIRVANAIATGWGKLNYSDTDGSASLMKVQLAIISGAPCADTYKADAGGRSMPQGLVPSQFCAGDLAGGHDTCQGDSGGPLQTTLAIPYCMYSVIGVTSFGKFCGFRNAPAIYTRVAHYIPWIESVVWP